MRALPGRSPHESVVVIVDIVVDESSPGRPDPRLPESEEKEREWHLSLEQSSLSSSPAKRTRASTQRTISIQCAMSSSGPSLPPRCLRQLLSVRIRPTTQSRTAIDVDRARTRPPSPPPVVATHPPPVLFVFPLPSPPPPLRH